MAGCDSVERGENPDLPKRKPQVLPAILRPRHDIDQDPEVKRLRGKAITLEVLVVVNVFYIKAFFISPLLKTSSDRTAFVYIDVLTGVLFGIAGVVGLTGLTKRHPQQVVRLLRVRIILDAALIAVVAVFALTLGDLPRQTAFFLIDRLPYLQEVGAHAVEKIIDWVIGGAVFEVVRSWFMRRFRRIGAHIPDRELDSNPDP